MADDRLLVLYDNRSSSSTLQPGWGFSALIEIGGHRVLFDTGADKLVLEHNATALGVDLATIDTLVLSHEHCDHIGALSSALHKDLSVVYPVSFSQGLKKKVSAAHARSVQVRKPIELSRDLFSTGELGTTIKEQSLIISTASGPVLITGCAHPGIVEIARTATDLAGEPLHLVLGGFHLYKSKDAEIKKIADALRQLGVKTIGPCHCTGAHAIMLLQQVFGPDGLEVTAGTQISL